MYAVINRKMDTLCYPVLNDNGSMKLFDSIEDADKEATIGGGNHMVISIEYVKE